MGSGVALQRTELWNSEVQCESIKILGVAETIGNHGMRINSRMKKLSSGLGCDSLETWVQPPV